MLEGWKKAELGDHIDLLVGYAFKSGQYSENVEDIRLLRGDNVIQGITRWDDAKRWPRNLTDGLDRYFLQVDDFVIAMDRTWVNAGIKVARITQDDIPSLLVQRVARLRGNNGLYQEYLAQILRTYKFEEYVKGVKTETAVPHISSDQIRDFPILLPSLMEQKKIAAILKTWDEVIEKTQASIVVKERKFDWMIKKLLHPKHHDNENVTEFQNVFEPFKEVNRDNADIEVLSVTKDGIVSQSEYFNKEIASEDRSKYLIVRRNMLVMSGLNFWMGAIDFQTMCDEGIVSPAYKTFRIINKDFDFDYLRFFIRSPYMTKILIDSSIQGASIVRRNMDTELLMNAVIPAPSLTQQKVIAEILNSAKREIGAHKALLTQYKNQKRGLMQKLLTGEWRVKVDGKSVEAA